MTLPELCTLLRENELFRVLDESDLPALCEEAELVSLPGGETLFRQGDLGDSVYIVLSGRLRVVLELSGGGRRFLGEVTRGESVGEMAILTGEPRSASVLGIRDTALLRLSKEAFDRIVEKKPRILLLIARQLVSRLRQAGRGPTEPKVRTIAVLGLQPEAGQHDFVMCLSSALAKTGSTMYLTAGLVDSLFGSTASEARDQLTEARMNAWLDAQESEHRFVIYEATSANSAWTSRCLRQADRVLLVGRADSPPPDGICDIGRYTAAQRELVLLHRDKSRLPSGTQMWLDLLGVETCHHLRADVQAGCEHLARTLTGKTVSLTLGGGGARGFAHIGVIRALREAGVPIDCIGGTSMGALVAGQAALGLNYKDLIEVNRRGWIGMNPLKDKTLPIVSVFSGQKLNRMLAMMLGDARIEDLWIRYFCVSANLTLAEEIIHDRGPLKRAVRASMSIPGVAPPLCENGNLIVDGGVLNNLPADIMRRMEGGTVIAVDVNPQKDLSVDPQWQETPSASRIVRSRVNPLEKPIKVPGLLTVLMRSMLLSSVHTSQEVSRRVDLYLRPPVDEFEIFEWHSLEKIADAGYRFARAKIEEWQRAMEQHAGDHP